MKIVFMGTPDFAAGALESLIAAGHEITAVVTQPDKPKGRSGALQAPPVKECAQKYNIPVFQPVKIKTPEATQQLRSYPADVFVVAAFGQILSQEILDIPKYGCLNIHASLLPKYRGASPIQNVILAGEEETGITVMQMNAGLDTGDILYVKKTPILDTDTFESLHDKLMVLGGEAICEALPLLEEGALTPVVQKEEDSCYAPLIKKEMGHLSFASSAAELDRTIRGMNPWPSAFAFRNGKQMKIWRASRVAPSECKVFYSEYDGNVKNGMILSLAKDHFVVACGNGEAIAVYELQMEGKKRMDASAFLLGGQLKVGEILD